MDLFWFKSKKDEELNIPETLADVFSLKWHLSYMEDAEKVAERSKDPIAKVGAIIVGDAKERICDGYNGFSRKVKEDDLESLFGNRELVQKRIVHAEANALMNALRRGSDVSNSIIYTTRIPCDRCLGLLSQVDISAVVVKRPDNEYLADHDLESIVENYKLEQMPLYFLDVENEELRRVA